MIASEWDWDKAPQELAEALTGAVRKLQRALRKLRKTVNKSLKEPKKALKEALSKLKKALTTLFKTNIGLFAVLYSALRSALQCFIVLFKVLDSDPYSAI